MRTWLPLVLTTLVVSLSGCGSDDPVPPAPLEPTTAEEGETQAAGSGRTEKPACRVSGSFTSDAAGHTDDVVSLDDLDAQEMPRYEFDGPADTYTHWTATGRGATGSRGPVKSYLVAFFDTEAKLGYRVQLTVFADAPTENDIEVRSFDKAIGTSTSPSKTIAWGIDRKRVNADGLADDGSGGTISFLTMRGQKNNGTMSPEYYYPVKVDLTFSDCPRS